MAAIPNRIVIGDNLFTFENEEIESVQSETAVSLIGEELYIDQFEATLGYTVYIRHVFAPSDHDGILTADNKIFATKSTADIRLVPYGTKVVYTVGEGADTAVSVFYTKNVERVGKGRYKLSCMSAIGLLNRQVHRGNIYTGEYITDVLTEIIGEAPGGNTYHYEIDSEVAKLRIYGRLPHSTRRQNLYQLLVAYGVNIIRTDAGYMKFTFLEKPPADIRELPEIPKARLYTGGSVTYDEPARTIEVVEHSYHYMDDVDEVVLFDNAASDIVTESLVVFEQPIYVSSIRQAEESKLTIHQKGVNYAIVSGTGTLLGKPYVHTTRILSETNDSAYAFSDRVVRVEEATLITIANSENVLRRLAQYYFNATTVKGDVAVSTERAGRLYSLWNAFQEDLYGFLAKMSTKVTSIRRTQCEFIQNYIPCGIGAMYTDHAIIPLSKGESKTWTVPSSVFNNKEVPNIRVVLIGYGATGGKGEDGQPGGLGNDRNGGEGGLGGAGGTGGNGAAVFVKTFNCTDEGFSTLTFDCPSSNNPEGFVRMRKGNTTVCSSGDGVSSPYGFYDEFSNMIFALPGHAGQAGAAGGHGGRAREIDFDYLRYFAYDEPEDGQTATYRGISYAGGSFPQLYDYNEAVRKCMDDGPNATPEEWAIFHEWEALHSGEHTTASTAYNGKYWPDSTRSWPTNKNTILKPQTILTPLPDEYQQPRRMTNIYHAFEMGISGYENHIICGRGGGGGAAVGGAGENGVGKVIAYNTWLADHFTQSDGWGAMAGFAGADVGGKGGNGSAGDAIVPRAMGENLVIESGGSYSGFTAIEHRYINNTNGRLVRNTSYALTLLVFEVEAGKQYTVYKNPLSTMRIACGTYSAADIAASTAQITTTDFAVTGAQSNDPLTLTIPEGSSYLYVQLYVNADTGMSNDDFFPTLQVYESQPIYGFGGNGGNGGGGAGGSGEMLWANTGIKQITTYFSGEAGEGGTGGAGSEGAPGCAIIYY